LGFLSFRVFLKLQSINEEQKKQLLEFLKKQQGTGWLVSVEGSWDINFVSWQENVAEFDLFWQEFLSTFKSSIADYKISIITRLHHYSRAYMLDKDNIIEISTTADVSKANIDATDKSILGLLAENARAKSVDIANEIGISEKVVRDRIKSMMKNKIILGFRTLPNTSLLNCRYYKLHVTLNTFKKDDLKAFKGYIFTNPHIVYYTETIGGFDVELDVQIGDSGELYELIKELKKNFSYQIRSVEFLEYTEEYKLKYLPKL
jgi:Lrp/AsnC family leucine-responsive transcriptional regulator